MLYNLPVATGVDLDPGHRRRARPRGREHPLHQEHHDRHGPVRAADPQPRRRHLDLRRLGQPAAGGPDRGRRRGHGRHRQRRPGRARRRLRRGAGRRPRGGPAGVGAGLPADRRDHVEPFIPAVKVGHGGGRLPGRRPRARRSPRSARAPRPAASPPTRRRSLQMSTPDHDGDPASVRRAQSTLQRSRSALLASTSSPARVPAGQVRLLHRRDRPVLRARHRVGRRAARAERRRRRGRRGGGRGAPAWARAHAQGALRACCTGSPTGSPRTPTCSSGSSPPTPASRSACRAGRRAQHHRHVPLHGRRAAGDRPPLAAATTPRTTCR